MRWQLLALYLLFVLPIYAVGFVFYYNASQRLWDDVTSADLSLARAIALETDDTLLKARQAVAEFAQIPAVVHNDTTGMEQIFAAGAAARQDINLFYRLSGDGIMLYHYPPAPGSTVGQDFSFRDYFQKAMQSGEHVFSKGRISPTTNRPVVSSVMPVLDGDRFAGVVAINLELQRLTEALRRIDPGHPTASNDKIIIVDTTGQVIAHSDNEILLENVLETLPGVAEVLNGQEGSVTAPDGAGDEWLYSYTPVPSAGWGVIVQRSTQQAFASLEMFQRGLILALIVFGLGAIFFWVVLSRRVINPLGHLTSYGQYAAQEQPEQVVGRDIIERIAIRPDQIGRLSRAMLQAEDNIRRRILELTTLNKTSASVTSTLDTGHVIDNILTEVQNLLSVRQSALLVVNQESQQLELRASRGLSEPAEIRLDLAAINRKMPVLRAIESGLPVQIPSLEPEANFLQPAPDSPGCRSALIIPITAPHTPPAVLIIYRADVHQFSPQEIDLATSFANHAAIALEHATLFSLTDAELQKQVRLLSALNRVGHTVSQSLEIGDVLNNAMDAVLQVMPADACWIYLQRETEEFLRLRAQHGLPDDVAERIRDRHVERNQGVMGQVAASGEPIFLEAADLNPEDWPNDPIITEVRWQSLAATPLMAKDHVTGILGIAAFTNSTFTESEVELLQAIGDQIAIAVVNARLYRRSSELATLEERNRVAREIHDTLAQGFTGILVQLQAAERLGMKNPEASLQSLREARELARESLQEARRSVLNLRPTVLENHTLDEAIAMQVGRFEAQTGITTRFLIEGYPVPLNPRVEKNLYRITQEALTNVTRHAEARHVWITLAYTTGSVQLTISDDGKGLNGQLEKLRATPGRTNGHFGLLGIQERARVVNGQAVFESPEAGGTTIKVVIPEGAT
ncbi:MAG: hypothetical protein Kow0031_26390 [Anaerolineae bacterium]